MSAPYFPKKHVPLVLFIYVYRTFKRNITSCLRYTHHSLFSSSGLYMTVPAFMFPINVLIAPIVVVITEVLYSINEMCCSAWQHRILAKT